MTTEVDVILNNPIELEETRKKLATRFNEIHDQKFKQKVNGRPIGKDGRMKWEVQEMKHNDSFTWIDSKFFYIPCHWSFEHALETEKNIRQVLKEFGIDATTRISD